MTKAYQLARNFIWLGCVCFATMTNSMANTAIDETVDIASEPQDASHYAFANYLGSGVYRTSEQSAAVLNIPLSFSVAKFTDSELFLRMPVSLGFFNYQFTDLPNGDIPSGVGTMVMTPGLAYHWQGKLGWRYESYLDLGFGYNFTNDNQLGIFSTGISALYDIDWPAYSPTWVNRIYYAGYRNKYDSHTESFSVFKTGIDIGINQLWQWGSVVVDPRLFASANWYFDQLKFNAVTKGDTYTNYSLELGFSLKFVKPFGWKKITIQRAGLSYQVGEGLKVIKVHFDFPL
jgi:hypothetical protein